MSVHAISAYSSESAACSQPASLDVTAHTLSSKVLISECSQTWRPMPAWAKYLIQLGFSWPNDESPYRRIVVISMPCDSAAAGLVSLGALVRDLTNPKTNDLEAHYAALARFARQYVECCKDCKVRCEPAVRKCGYASEAKGQLRSRDGKRYQVLSTTHDTPWGEAISCKSDREERQLLSQNAAGWKIDGEPWVQPDGGNARLIDDLYSAFIKDAHPFPDNLTRSFAGLCLAGRAGGKAATREIFDSMRLRINEQECSLSKILTVRGWADPETISRICFFNTRTEQFDRYGYTPSLAIADGDASFLALISNRQFQRSDVIGVIHRTIERNRLDAVGHCLASLKQWYDDDLEVLQQLPPLPRGVTASVLRKRTP